MSALSAQVTRRQMLRFGGFAAAAGVLAACSSPAAAPPPAPTTAPAAPAPTSAAAAAPKPTTAAAGATTAPTTAAAAAAKPTAAPAVSQNLGGDLNILQWNHFVPAYDTWFDQMAADWGTKNKVNVTVDHISNLDLPARLAAESAAKTGHDIIQFQAQVQTYRYEGHNVGDVQNYREKSEVAAWLESRDPIDRLRRRLADQGDLDEGGFGAATSRAAEIVADAIAFAEASPWPDPASVNRAWPAAAAGRP